jgi:hypothetical protein
MESRRKYRCLWHFGESFSERHYNLALYYHSAGNAYAHPPIIIH